ncbi:MlaE family lipid ABC transporter permease subunit [Synechococcus sp. PCC 7336]|uniref:MlaE family lipid ABC transporter permease subunit n=1 Tax=Synechococcus sp. PCC 7336 TaxID=195250 RepID=UPI0012EAA342|nr:MlaE family lipid ABC transporter permease subunit [Synechococcus sp. PCC 7336]
MNWFSRFLESILLTGQVVLRLFHGRLYRRNTVEQLSLVGTESLLVVLITALVISGVFTIQVAREFINFGASSAIGGVLALALAREMTPVLTAVVVAGRVGSAFAAELGTMEVTEQIDALRVLRTNPVEYLVVPRVIACALMVPILTVISLITGILGGLLICVSRYGLTASSFLNSAQNFLAGSDLIFSVIKAFVFGVAIAIIGCSWGLTTTGGAKGVGRSTTAAVVTALLTIFIANFFMSWLFFPGTGSSVNML